MMNRRQYQRGSPEPRTPVSGRSFGELTKLSVVNRDLAAYWRARLCFLLRKSGGAPMKVAA